MDSRVWECVEGDKEGGAVRELRALSLFVAMLISPLFGLVKVR